MLKICQHCAKEFEAGSNKYRKFCGLDCELQGRAPTGRKKTGVVKQCDACGKDYYVPAYRAETARFCSRDCQNHLQHERLIKQCVGCNKEFTVSNSREPSKYCSVECRNEHRKPKIAYESEKRKLTNAINTLNRDLKSTSKIRYYLTRLCPAKCQSCGLEDDWCCFDLHHINGNPNDNRLENIAVLCAICHRKLHSKLLNDPKFPYTNHKEFKKEVYSRKQSEGEV